MSDKEEAARQFFCQPCEFVMSATAMDKLPPGKLPEIAFIGRSNVGKSSLINALTGRKALARTSNTPGRTQMLNFFRLADTLMLVDLPGYGYAKASKSSIEQWNYLIRDYLSGRAPLRRVCVLIDSRHGIKPSDVEMMEMLDKHAVSYQLVLTKRDKIKASDAEKVMASAATYAGKHPAMHAQLIITSSVKSDGLAELKMALHALAKE